MGVTDRDTRTGWPPILILVTPYKVLNVSVNELNNTIPAQWYA